MSVAFALGWIGEAFGAEAVALTLSKQELRSGSWRRQFGEDAVVDVTIGSDVTSLPEHCFAEMKGLRSVDASGATGLVSVGKYAFLGCVNLREVTLPGSVTTLGIDCFRECESLRSIVIPAKVTEIPKHAFEWCGSLREVSLPAGLKKIEMSAFKYCYALESVSLPAGLRKVGMNAFTYCTSLTEVTIPTSVLEVASYAFSECISLRRAVLPANSSMLGELIFSGCRELEELVEGSVTPPEFECYSTIFEPEETEMYRHCKLIVKDEQTYRRAPGWKLFFNY